MSGIRSHMSGLSAEDRVAALYQRAGCTVAAQRWRGAGGEIDLVLRDGNVTVFVEVKAARSLATAAERIGPRQARRVMCAAEEYMAQAPGVLAEMRFDVALVDGSGRIEIVANAFVD